MIIPQITKAVKNDIPHDHVIFNPNLQYCPCCGFVLKIETSDSGVKNYVCPNGNCKGKLSNRIDHYLGEKGLDVKGISKATIEKLIDWGWVNGLRDIYKLDRYKAEWVSKAGFGQASVGKILNNINASKNGVQLYKFISAIGIPLIGSTVAKEIVKHYPTWTEFRAAIGSNWYEIEGFGPEMDRTINNFDYTEADDIASLLTFAEDQPSDTQSQSTVIKDKKIVITGRLLLIQNREKLSNIVEEKGGKVTSTISSQTDYLMCNDKNSSSTKMKKALALNIPIINEEELLNMCNYKTE